MLAGMWPGPFSPTAGTSANPAPASTVTFGTNLPQPPAPPLPDPRESQDVNRHLRLRCFCPLIDCCHNEDQEPCRSRGPHAHSGSPVSGYTQPWEPGDESWREVPQSFTPPPGRARRAGRV